MNNEATMAMANCHPIFARALIPSLFFSLTFR
jgi:hypothetical protein